MGEPRRQPLTQSPARSPLRGCCLGLSSFIGSIAATSGNNCPIAQHHRKQVSGVRVFALVRFRPGTMGTLSDQKYIPGM